MKKLFLKLKNTVLDFFKWVWKECKDWRTILLLGVVCLVLSAPIWVLYLLSLLFHWQWAFIAATVIWAFWMLPGAPFFAVAVSITLAIRKLVQSKRKKRQQKNKTDDNP